MPGASARNSALPAAAIRFDDTAGTLALAPGRARALLRGSTPFNARDLDASLAGALGRDDRPNEFEGGAHRTCSCAVRPLTRLHPGRPALSPRAFDDPTPGRAVSKCTRTAERRPPGRPAAARVHARAAVAAVDVFVRHDGLEEESPYEHAVGGEHPGERLRGRARRASPALLVTKHVNSAFHGSPDLEAWREPTASTRYGLRDPDADVLRDDRARGRRSRLRDAPSRSTPPRTSIFRPRRRDPARRRVVAHVTPEPRSRVRARCTTAEHRRMRGGAVTTGYPPAIAAGRPES